MRQALARQRIRRDRLLHGSAIRFGGLHGFPRLGFDPHRGGRCLPVAMCARLASDTPVASPTMPMTLARA